MRLTDPLNDRQLQVLRWIADGCPVGVFETSQQYKHSAGALQGRRLIKISKKNGWSASLTDAGHFYIEHGRFPDLAATTTSAEHRATATKGAITVRRAVAAADHRLAVPVAELLRQLASGPVTIEDPDAELRAAWRRTIDATRRSGQIPDSFHLVHHGRDRGDLVIELRRGVHPVHREALDKHERVAVDVSEHVEQLHPILASIRSRAASVLSVSAGSAPRALLLLHGLFLAAEREGCTVSLGDNTDIDFEFRRAGFSCGLTIREEQEVRDVMPAPDELAGTKTYAWQRVRSQPRSMPSGRLAIEIGETDRTFSGRRRNWADRQRWQLETKLGEVLAEILHRLHTLEQRADAAARAAEQRQLDWQQAMQVATDRFHQARRVALLDVQLGEWEKADRIRAFCADLEAADDDLDDGQRAWIDWARSYADELDPRRRAVRGPEVVEPRPQDLRPFLAPQWSPYGSGVSY